MERRCQLDVAFSWLSANATPDYRSISRFRRRHLEALSDLFIQVLQLCATAGLIKLGRVALDGTKLRACASRHKAMSYDPDDGLVKLLIYGHWKSLRADTKNPYARTWDNPFVWPLLPGITRPKISLGVISILRMYLKTQGRPVKYVARGKENGTIRTL